MSKVTASPTFAAIAQEFVAALVSSVKRHGAARQLACVLVAVGYLSKMTKGQINEAARSITGVSDEVWAHGKSEFSKAWRSLDDSPGKYGAGEILAQMWAARNFAVTLDKAYELSGGPRKEVDKVESIAKQLAVMSAEDVQSVLGRLLEIQEVQAYAHNDIQAIVKLGIVEVLSVSKAVSVAA